MLLLVVVLQEYTGDIPAGSTWWRWRWCILNSIAPGPKCWKRGNPNIVSASGRTRLRFPCPEAGRCGGPFWCEFPALGLGLKVNESSGKGSCLKVSEFSGLGAEVFKGIGFQAEFKRSP